MTKQRATRSSLEADIAKPSHNPGFCKHGDLTTAQFTPLSILIYAPLLLDATIWLPSEEEARLNHVVFTGRFKIGHDIQVLPESELVNTPAPFLGNAVSFPPSSDDDTLSQNGREVASGGKTEEPYAAALQDFPPLSEM